ncbi:MAG: hypothetical protein ACRC14_02745 [Paracoccaceae bacterium]
MARPPITAVSENLFRKQLNAAFDYVEGLSGGAGPIDALSDVTITAPSVGQVLKWNGSAWVNDTDATGGGGGGGATGGSAVLDFGTPPGSGVTSAVVTGQAGILSGSRIRAWIQGSTADHNAYEHTRILPGRIGLAAGDVVVGTGFTIHAETELRLTGDVAVNWEWA